MNPRFFPTPDILIFARTKQHLPSKKVLKMSNSMGIASAFVLSSLFLSPFAMAEESQAFVAQNSARAAAYQAHQSEMTAKAQEATQAPQAANTQGRIEKDS
ncbi:hypothetical protein SAMN04490202_3710 [Pseudomonas reinekei]|uniref:Uncharacterized protein n=2 Tax=Pseudomonas reinekei TaxID=395598 RepID=A0A1H0RP41_PSERE|nr:hypothetical protein [Pseudomonas reinekei]SDP31244.1 hypothetical protein SAMN04490202_3710 [Pseudomonas reinekei]